MADFIPKAQNPDPEVTPPADTKIKVGEQEYSQADVERLVGLGQKVEEIEKHHGSFDKYVSEHGRKDNELGELRSEIENLRKAEIKLKEIQAKDAQAGEPWTPEQKELAKKQLQELVGGKIMTDAEFEQKYAERRAGEKLLEECQELENEIDGTDGRPKFSTMEILEHMKDPMVPKNPLKAYKDKYESQLDEWKTKQIGATRTPGLVTNTQSTTAKQPSKVRITNENLTQAIRDELYGGSQ